jgi:short-subunit dehydrogenase
MAVRTVNRKAEPTILTRKEGGLKGYRSVLVTGASSGIGLATARKFSELGMRVMLLSNVADDLRQAVLSLAGEAAWREVDLTVPEQRENLLPAIERDWGPIDVLVNCAGIGYEAEVRELQSAALRRLFEVNFFAVVDLSQQALEAMSSRGRGHIVNVTSASARRAVVRIGGYAASKAAVHAFTQSLRLEAGKLRVGVSEVLPISVRTNFFRDSHSVRGGYRPHGLVQTPEHIADCIVKAVRNNRAEVCSHWPTALGFALDAALPNWVAALLAKF